MLFALAGLWYFLAIVSGIATLVFFVMVLIEMFKRDQSTLGIVCIVLTFCTGIGPLVAFVFGWMKATEWNLKKTMTYWTVAFVLYFLFLILALASLFGGAATMPTQYDADPTNMNFEFDTDGSGFSIPEDFNMPENDAMPDVELQPETSPTDQP